MIDKILSNSKIFDYISGQKIYTIQDMKKSPEKYFKSLFCDILLIILGIIYFLPMYIFGKIEFADSPYKEPTLRAWLTNKVKITDVPPPVLYIPYLKDLKGIKLKRYIPPKNYKATYRTPISKNYYPIIRVPPSKWIPPKDSIGVYNLGIFSDKMEDS